MFFRQYQLGCLSLFSYLIGDEATGRAVVVDPQRDVSQYLADADAHDLRIERVIETHFHADFLSGHLELAAATGATVSFGEGAQAGFPIEALADGTRLVLGDVVLEIRATPGHTPESISVVVFEHPGAEPWGVLTGDALFIGDVGRPDLLASAGWTPDQLARRLYRSLRDKLLTLPDSTRVFPAHGAGSACGKSMSDAVVSTIGEQKLTNYALGADERRRVRRGVDPRPVGGAAVLRVRRRCQPSRTPTARRPGTGTPARAARGRSSTTERGGADRRAHPRGVRVGPPARLDQRWPRRKVRRVRRRRRATGATDRGHHRPRS